MQWIVDDNLTNFPFWSSAADRAKMLTHGELQELDELLSQHYGDNAPPASEINDLFMFKFGDVCSLLGLNYDKERNVIVRDEANPDLESVSGGMQTVFESIRKDNPAIADAIEAGYKACIEGAIGDPHDRFADHTYSPDVVLDDQPNFSVIISTDSMDPHPARVLVQARDEASAIDEAVDSLVAHGMSGYIEEDEPEHPEDYIEVSKGWIPSHLIQVNPLTGSDIRTAYVPEQFLSAIVNADRSGLSSEDEADLEEYCKDLADSGIPESGLSPVCGPDGEFWDVDDDPYSGKSVLCSVFVGR